MKLSSLQIPSKRLVASYIFDWLVIAGIAGIGAGFNSLSPYHRPFSLLDLSISFPYTIDETCPVWLLVVVALIAPGAIIFFVCLIFIPGPTANPSTPKSLIWRRKFWEWHTGWMGLALSLATAFLVTEGMKNLFGKPRPDLLSRCIPNIENLDQYVVGGNGQDISSRWTLVSYDICQQTDHDKLDDGFRSFPSGHSSFSWAGLLYLTFFLCSKFAIAIPFLAPRPYSQDPTHTALEREQLQTHPHFHHHHHHQQPSSSGSNTNYHHRKVSSGLSNTSATTTTTNDPSTYLPIVPIRNQAAAPPTWTLALFFVPVGAAIWISASRYHDFRHHGFDIITGALIGAACAWAAFRWYHLPVRQGAGWAWGARSRDRAFAVGVGVGSYVGVEGWASASASASAAAARDMEAGAGVQGQGLVGPGMDGAREQEEVGAERMV